MQFFWTVVGCNPTAKPGVWVVSVTRNGEQRFVEVSRPVSLNRLLDIRYQEGKVVYVAIASLSTPHPGQIYIDRREAA